MKMMRKTDICQYVLQYALSGFCLLLSLQARILALNASYFLKAEGHFVISIKVCIYSFSYVDLIGLISTCLTEGVLIVFLCQI